MNQHEQDNSESEVGLGDDGFTDMSKLIADAVERIRQRKGNPEVITGIPTCFMELDRYTSGLQRGDLIVVAGRPGMGKHIFVRDIAMHVALANKLPVAIMEVDKGGVLLAMSMLAKVAIIDWSDLHKGRVDQDESERLESAVDVLIKAPIYFSSLTPLSVQELGEQLRKLNKRTGGLGLVVVDCLPELRLTGEKMSGDCALKTAHTSRYLKALAQELDVSMVVLSPVERGVEDRCEKWPSLSDLPGNAAITNAADLVLFAYRDEMYNIDSEEKGTTTIIVSRNRGGFIGSFCLKYDGYRVRFDDTNHQM